MLSLSRLPPRPDSHSLAERWAFLAAAAATGAVFSLLLASMSGIGVWSPLAPSTSDDAPTIERVVYATPRVAMPSVEVAARATRTPQLVPPAASPGVARPATPEIVPRDTGSTHAAGPLPVRDLSPPSPVRPSSRLAPPRSARGAESWVPAVRDPFVAPAPLTPVVRDSLLADLRAAVPAMARARRPTQGERDAAIKDGMLRNHVAGRTLLDPPVGGGGGGGFSLPLFSAGPSRAQRVRDSIVFAENRPRLERLRQRAESLSRRGDSLRP